MVVVPDYKTLATDGTLTNPTRGYSDCVVPVDNNTATVDAVIGLFLLMVASGKEVLILGKHELASMNNKHREEEEELSKK